MVPGPALPCLEVLTVDMHEHLSRMHRWVTDEMKHAGDQERQLDQLRTGHARRLDRLTRIKHAVEEAQRQLATPTPPSSPPANPTPPPSSPPAKPPATGQV